MDKYNVKIMNRALRDLDQIYDYIAMTILRNSPMKGSGLLRRHGNVRRYETDSTAPEHLGRAGVFLFLPDCVNCQNMVYFKDRKQ